MVCRWEPREVRLVAAGRAPAEEGSGKWAAAAPGLGGEQPLLEQLPQPP